MPLEMSQITREYVWWEVTTPNDLTGSTAEVSFQDAGIVPDELDWTAAALVEEGGKWFVRSLVSGNGAGGEVELDVGDHQAWIRITDNPERPVRQPGVVTIS